jgi:hypothetical protein
LSEEQQERIEIDIDNNNGSFESSDITEVVEVVENPNTETFPLSSKEEEDQKNEIKTDDSNRYKWDIYEQVKGQSIQLSNLASTVESLQFQVKQLQESIRLLKHKKTSSVRKRITSNDDAKTKKKTKRRGNARSRKKWNRILRNRNLQIILDDLIQKLKRI